MFKSSDLSDPPSRKQATILQAVGGYVNTGIVIVQGLLLVPLYLHFIGAHMYGLWLASGGMLGMLGLMNFGVSSLVIQRVASAYGQKDHAKAGAYFINGVAIYFGICLLYAMAGWIASIWLPTILNVMDDDIALLRQCFQLAVLAMTIGIFNECLRSFSQALLKPVIPMVGMAVGRIFGIGVTTWMLFNNFGLWAIPAGVLMAECVIFIINLLYVIALFQRLAAKVRLDRGIIRDYMRTSPALLVARIGNTVPQESEPLLIAIFLGPEVTTAYMITRRAADIVFNLLSQIVGASMGPFAHLVGSSNLDRVTEVAYRLLASIFLLGLIGFSSYAALNSGFVTLWVGEEFVLNSTIILLVGIGFFVQIVRSILWQVLNGLGDFIFTSLILLLEGIIRIGLVLAMLPMIGIVMLPLALGASCMVSLTIFILRACEKLPLKIKPQSLVKALIMMAISFGAAALVIPYTSALESWASFVICLVGFVLACTTIIAVLNRRFCHRLYKFYIEQ